MPRASSLSAMARSAEPGPEGVAPEVSGVARGALGSLRDMVMAVWVVWFLSARVGYRVD